ncbi:MAG: PQQ-binding-like beta-propeller repeat protein [Planctomycetes bacterium]|nr:PQQ-binding-like beta-propeller repeat protein [Planctomycetota bacterium]
MQRGEAPDLDLPDTWSQGGENLLWTRPYGGRSCPLVMNGRVYIIGAAGDGIRTQERVTCFDAETGDVLWEHPFNVFHSDIVTSRVGWAALAGDLETGYVYAHGVQDLLLCLDPSGKVVWSHSLKEEFGSVTGYGGRIHTPIVDEDRVIISFLSSSWGAHGRPLHRYLALDKRTGAVLWWAGPGEQPQATNYSTPVLAVVKGQRLMIAGNADGSIYALKARTGETVWTFRLSRAAINPSVVVDGDRVYACHGEANLDGTTAGRVVCIDGTGTGDITKTHEVWRYDALQSGYASPAFHDGRLYVSDDSANLHCLDAQTRKLLWRHKLGRSGRGSTPLWADGKLYVSENQTFHILRPEDETCVSLDIEQFPGPEGPVEVWGTPAVANGRVYFTTMSAIYALGRKSWSGKTSALPQPAAEKPADPTAEPAWIQIVPAEVALAPGEAASFEVRAYDDAGRFLRTVSADLTAENLPGEISPEGRFQAPSETPGQAGLIQAKAGKLATSARVRILPRMPFAEDFERYKPGTVPSHWIATPVKYVVAEQEGGKVLRKTNVNPSPPVARAMAFIGPPDWHGYSIQADCMGTEVRNNLPEMGIVNSRYRLVLVGNDEQLALDTWDALPRINQRVDFTVEPGAWYRMKLRVDVESEAGPGLIRGKVWPRDEPEPDTWTVQVEDPIPNRQGSPGIYSFATGIVSDAPGTEVFFDNVRVEPN